MSFGLSSFLILATEDPEQPEKIGFWYRTFIGRDEDGQRGILLVFWNWLNTVSRTTIDGIVIGFLDHIPLFDQELDQNALTWVLTVANYYMPIDLALTLLTGYLAFLIGFIMFKYVILALPTIG